MSLTLLPAVDVRDGKAVRLRQGESGSETDYGSPLVGRGRRRVDSSRRSGCGVRHGEQPRAAA